MEIRIGEIKGKCDETKVEGNLIMDPMAISFIDKMHGPPPQANTDLLYFEVVYYGKSSGQPFTVSNTFSLDITPIIDKLKELSSPFIPDMAHPSTLKELAQLFALNFKAFRKHLYCFNGVADEHKNIADLIIKNKGRVIGVRFGI